MSEFIKYLIKKSDIEKSEYFRYKKTRNLQNNKEQIPIKYKKILLPNVYNYCVLDFETTGVDKNKNAITEIGCIKVEQNEICDTFDTLVNPEQFIPLFVSSKTNITNEMVKNMDTISVVLPKLIDFIGNMPLVIHNAPFDMKFLLHNCKKNNIEINNHVLDTLYLSRKFFPELKHHNLDFLRSTFGISDKDSHRALSDVIATFHIYKIIQNKYISK